MSRFEALRQAQDQERLSRYYDRLFGWGQPLDESDLSFVAYMLAVRHEAIGNPRTDTQWEFPSFLKMRLTHSPITLDSVLAFKDRSEIVADFIEDTLELLTTDEQRERLHLLVGTYARNKSERVVLDAFYTVRNAVDPEELAARFDQMFNHAQPSDDSDVTLVAVLLAAVHEAVGEPRSDTPWPSPMFLDQGNQGAESSLDQVLWVSEPERSRRREIVRALVADARPRMNEEQQERLDSLFSAFLDA